MLSPPPPLLVLLDSFHKGRYTSYFLNFSYNLVLNWAHVYFMCFFFHSENVALDFSLTPNKEKCNLNFGVVYTPVILSVLISGVYAHIFPRFPHHPIALSWTS